MKFGGALMSNAHNIRRVGELIEEFSCEPLVVIVSAIGKTTNKLESIFRGAYDGVDIEDEFIDLKDSHQKIISDLFPVNGESLKESLDAIFDDLWNSLNDNYSSRYEAYDSIVSYGEEISSYILYQYLLSKSFRPRLINAKSIISTDSNYTDASVNWKTTEQLINSRVLPAIENKEVVITQGFIGADEYGKPTTLGREGSDFTAAIIGNIINANEVTIWKNVPGLMNADPNRFDNAIKLDNISYHEAIELAYYGASVIHPKTIQPLKQKNIPLLVRPIYNPALNATVIDDNTENDNKTPSIIVKDNQVLFSVSTQNLSFIGEESLKQIFGATSKCKIHVNLMQNSAVSFSFCFNYDKIKLESLIEILGNSFNLKYNTGLQLITVRHYTNHLVDELIGEKEVLLIQQSRATTQVLVRI